MGPVPRPTIFSELISIFFHQHQQKGKMTSPFSSLPKNVSNTVRVGNQKQESQEKSLISCPVCKGLFIQTHSCHLTKHKVCSEFEIITLFHFSSHHPDIIFVTVYQIKRTAKTIKFVCYFTSNS